MSSEAAPTLAIGDFSRATHLSIKTLRHYHEAGLLEPAHVDPGTGYRRYRTDQIAKAQIIRRFRDLDMPLTDIRAVLAAPDMETRNRLIVEHLRRLEGELARTQGTVASLRDLLEQPAAPHIGRRRVESVAAIAIREFLDVKDALAWFHGALGEMRAVMGSQGLVATGPAGGIYSPALFEEGRGESVLFIPFRGKLRPIGRVAAFVAPAAELAVALHAGPHAGIDRTYGALATYVTQHALAVDGPLREYYVVGPLETADESEWRTEIGWPIFQTGPAG
jgi:DNA-binding transcriptional MerR regulator